MNFHSSTYGFFFIVVFTLFWLLRARRRERTILLLLASWFFYASWNAKYLLLIIFSTVLDYWVGLSLGKLDPKLPENQKKRRLLLLASLVGNLGCLGTFKYYGFFRENIEFLLSGFGIHIPHLNVLLPVGISFYTFQTLSYTIEVYWGKLEPKKSFIDFALFVAFFPQLVAGPIVRASHFLPQIQRFPRIDRNDFMRGLYRIAEGLGKKVLLADLLGAHLVDKTFIHGSPIEGLQALFAIYGYAIQIYCDFSGYSDIAIGSAMLLGFKIPENFNAPFKARNVRDFWRRWHLSLSTWLRDYLYIPLGGNRKGEFRTYLNLFITMALGGLWHGASWSYVVFGVIHGVWLAGTRWYDKKGFPAFPGRIGKIIAIFLTFHVFCLSLFIFRANDFTLAWEVLMRVGRPWHIPNMSPYVWAALIVGFISHYLPETTKKRVEEMFVGLPAPLVGFFWVFFIGLIAAAKEESIPFIYFQF